MSSKLEIDVKPQTDLSDATRGGAAISDARKENPP